MEKDDSMDFVVGFLFDSDAAVVLVRKNRPDWQKGRLNGVGGKIKHQETPWEAMRREFNEEAGVDIDDWRQFAKLDFSGGRVFFFVSHRDVAIRSMTDETVSWYRIKELPEIGEASIVHNLRWMIPLALDKDKIMAWASEGTIR